MDASKVTSTLIAGALAVLAGLTASHGVHVPSDTQAVLVAGITLLAGFVAPSITEFANRYRNVISAVLTIAAGAVSFAVANSTGGPVWLIPAATGAIAFLTSLLLPSTSHPSRLAVPPPSR